MHSRETDKHNTQPEEKRERNKERTKKQRGEKKERQREKVVTKELGCPLSVQHS